MSFDPKIPHVLEKFPKSIDYDKSKFLEIIGETRALLGELKGSCRSIPEPKLLTYPTLIKEAVDSSKIENIETKIIDVLQNQVLPESLKQDSNESKVLRYRDAAMWGFNNIQDMGGLSTRLILGIQERLLKNGDDGYRRLQNEIVNKATGEIVYTPPIASSLNDYMSNWENFVNNIDTNLDPLIKCAISHYQFEAIHPFTDGNGRTGRILMLLQLVKDNVLEQPILYVSNYINKHRPEYYTCLNNVTIDNNWEEYIGFILQAFYEQSKATNALVAKIKELQDSFLKELRENNSTKLLHNLDMIVSKLFTYPVISPKLLSDTLGVGQDTASKNLKLITETGLLEFKKVGIFNLYQNVGLVNLMNDENL